MEHRTLDRREFTLQSAMAILSAATITISGCGGGGSSPAPAPTPGPTGVYRNDLGQSRTHGDHLRSAVDGW